MKIEILCTNCEKVFTINTEDRFINDICPHCGHSGDIKFRFPGRWEEEEADAQKGKNKK